MVVEGAALACSFGSAEDRLCIPGNRGVYLDGRKHANVADHVGGVNIASFGTCSGEQGSSACAMATGGKWLNGDGSVFVDGEAALSMASINICGMGGVK